jgi:oligoribonuclease
MAPATHLLWLDLETTGVDESADPILEIGAILTSIEPPFAELAEAQVVTGAGLDPDWRDRMNATVLEMHTGNGLLAAVAESRSTVADAAQRIIAQLLEPHTRPHRVLLAGSGVGHFDRRFVAAQMPALDAWLQYPCLDVGVIRRGFGIVGRPDLVPASGQGAAKPHRALEDARLHLTEWRHYALLFEDIPTS